MEKLSPFVRKNAVQIGLVGALIALAASCVLLAMGLDEARASADDAYALAEQRGYEIEDLRRELRGLDGQDISDRVDAVEGRVTDLEDAQGRSSHIGSGIYSLEDRVSRLERENRYRY